MLAGCALAVEASAGEREFLPKLLSKWFYRGRFASHERLPGPDYPDGQIVWRLYAPVRQGRVRRFASRFGLGDHNIQMTSRVIASIGISASPAHSTHRASLETGRTVRFDHRPDEFPGTIRGTVVQTHRAPRYCREYDI